jgi:hypothetical protein
MSASVVRIQGKHAREMEYLIEQYQKAHPDEDASMIEPHLVADWAWKKGLWSKPPVSPAEILRREIARHLKSEYITDPKNRTVRKHHAILFVEHTAEGSRTRSRYAEIFEATGEHMKASLALRRRSALSDVRQLNIDFESWNDFNRHGETLEPMDFDFNKDLAEEAQPTHYPVEAPPDFDDEL